MQQRPYAANTIAARVSAVSAFYRWCVREELIDRNPMEAIRRPSKPIESSTSNLTHHQLTDCLSEAERRGDDWWAAAMLLDELVRFFEAAPRLNGLPDARVGDET